MDIDNLLAAHEQDPDVQTTVHAVRSMRAAIAGVDGMQYQPARTAELKANIMANAIAAGVMDLRQMLADAARADTETMDDRDNAERERLANANGHAFDPSAFTSAATPAEISVLLNDALAMDADTARKAWHYAQPALKQMATTEMRSHRMPHATSAFNIWTVWQSKMANLTQRAPDRATLSARAARRQRELRDKVLAVWRVVGLDHAVTKQLLVADVTERTPEAASAKGSLVVGRWFDQFGNRK